MHCATSSRTSTASPPLLAGAFDASANLRSSDAIYSSSAKSLSAQ